MVTQPVTAPVIAATYARVSTRMQGRHGFSLGNQDQTLEGFVAANGWTLPDHLRFKDGEEENASGTSWDLPDLTRMLEAARRGEFQVLVVPDFDRFARSLTKGLVLEEQLRKYNVRVVYQRVPVEDTPEGQLLKTQLYAFAEYERQKLILRTTVGRRAKAQAGKVVGVGPAPYGYRFTYETLDNGKRRVCGIEPDPITAPIAREILTMLLTRSTLDVMQDLNARGIPGPSGGLWNATTLHRMALNPVYIGTWVYGKNGRRSTPEQPVGVPVAVAPLISRQTWDDIQRAFAHRVVARRGRGPVESDPWLLRSFLTCGHCHGAIRTTRNQGNRYYACSRHMPTTARRAGKPVCCLPDIPALDLEAELGRVLDATLLDPESLAAGLAAGVAQHQDLDRVRQDRLAAIAAEVARQRKRLDTLTSSLADAGTGEVFASMLRQARDIEDIIGRLAREQADLAAASTEGLTPDEATEIERLAAEVRDGLALATSAERRQLYELLRVRGTVYVDPEGVRLGKRNAFRIDWAAAIPLPHSLNRNLKRVKRSAE